MLTIFIVRKTPTLKDDIIWVSRGDGHLFRVLYEEGISPAHQSFVTDESGIIQYFYNLFDMLTMDDEPFWGIQFNIPTYPSIMFNLDNMSDAKIKKFMRILRHSIENFPHHTFSYNDVLTWQSTTGNPTVSP